MTVTELEELIVHASEALLVAERDRYYTDRNFARSHVHREGPCGHRTGARSITITYAPEDLDGKRWYVPGYGGASTPEGAVRELLNSLRECSAERFAKMATDDPARAHAMTLIVKCEQADDIRPAPAASTKTTP